MKNDQDLRQIQMVFDVEPEDPEPERREKEGKEEDQPYIFYVPLDCR